MKQNVLFVTRKYPPATGGMETFSWELTNRLTSHKKVIKIAQQKQRHILWILPLLCVRALPAIRHFSIIHLGDLVLAPIARILRMFTNKPIIVTVHALELTYKSSLLRWLIDTSLSSITHFVAVSDYTRSLLIKRGVDHSKISVIPHGVDSPTMNRAASRAVVEKLAHATAQTTILLSVGRHQRRKGFAWFLEFVLPLLSSIDYRYVITSSGPETERIKQFVAQHGLEESVIMAGKVDDQTLHHLYAGSDCFVMPNIPVEGDAEGFGFVAIEAASYGLPVLAARLEGITSAITHEQNGLLIAPKDAETYANTILDWHAHPEKREQFSEQARSYTAAHCAWDTPVAAYEQLYTQFTS